MYQNDAKYTLKGHRANFLLKWQQPDFKGISPFCKGTEDFSAPAEKESRRYSPCSFLINLGSFVQSYLLVLSCSPEVLPF